MNVITLKRSPSTNPTDAASNPTTSIVPPIFVEGESKLPPEFFFVATKSENCGDVKILRGVALQTQPNRHDCHSGHRSRRQIGQCAKWVQARRTRPQSGPECRSYRVLYSRQSCQGGVTSHMRTALQRCSSRVILDEDKGSISPHLFRALQGPYSLRFRPCQPQTLFPLPREPIRCGSQSTPGYRQTIKGKTRRISCVSCAHGAPIQAIQLSRSRLIGKAAERALSSHSNSPHSWRLRPRGNSIACCSGHWTASAERHGETIAHLHGSLLTAWRSTAIQSHTYRRTMSW